MSLPLPKPQGVSLQPDNGGAPFVSIGSWALGAAHTCHLRYWLWVLQGLVVHPVLLSTKSMVSRYPATSAQRREGLQGIKNQTTPCPGRWQSLKAGLRAGEEPSPGGSLQESTRARTPACRLTRGANKPGVLRMDQVGQWLGNPGPCPLPSARGSQEPPVAATHMWLHWLEASLKV